MTPEDEAVEGALALFRALAHPDRLRALLALREAPLCVSQLTTLCGISQSGMSHQLRLLRDAGLVATERRGRKVYYSLADHHVAHIIGDAVLHAAEPRCPADMK